MSAYPYSADFSASRSGHTSPDSGGDFATSSIYSSSHGGGGGGGGGSASGGYPASLTSASTPGHENNLSSFGLRLLSEQLADDEIAQIESFYKGLYSHVFVCPAVAALYLFAEGNVGGSVAGQSGVTGTDITRYGKTQPDRTVNRVQSDKQPVLPAPFGVLNRSTSSGATTAKTGWTLEFATGVPVVVHVTRPGQRSVHFIFAERATGFPLWQDSHLSPSSHYTCIDSDYHEFVSTTQTRVGLRFGVASAASKFLQQVVTLISNPATYGDVKNAGRNRKQVTQPSITPKKSNQLLPKKSSISPPCCFQHRTHVSREDELRSLTDFVGSVRKSIFTVVENRASVNVSTKIYGTCR